MMLQDKKRIENASERRQVAPIRPESRNYLLTPKIVFVAEKQILSCTAQWEASLVEGDMLADRLQRGPLPFDE